MMCSKCSTQPREAGQTWCKVCRVAGQRSKLGLITVLYSAQRNNSRQRGHNQLHKNWREADYITDLRPSIDRKDESIYC